MYSIVSSKVKIQKGIITKNPEKQNFSGFAKIYSK